MQSLTVLLAEDEPIISMDIRYLLEGKGIRVIHAPEPQELIYVCEQQQPNLVLLNFKQRNQADGMTLARILKQRFALTVLFVTGARSQDLAASKDFDSGFPVLYKPFTRAQLWRCLSSALGMK